MIMRFRLDWGSAANRFRLLLLKYPVLVQGINAARCNNYCSALMILDFSFTLTDQCACALRRFTIAGPGADA